MKIKPDKIITKDGTEYPITKKKPKHVDDPFFRKKAEESVKTLNKHGFPVIPEKKK